MKSIFITLAAAVLAGCGAEATGTANTPAPERSEKLQSVTSHTTENAGLPPQNVNGTAPTGPKARWSQSGDAIDTSSFDAAIARAEKNFKRKPAEESVRKDLSNAYYARGVALTEARQYASALGDYRRAVKLDPANTEANDWIEKIVMIYTSMNRQAPNEGAEPPPLPFKGS